MRRRIILSPTLSDCSCGRLLLLPLLPPLQSIRKFLQLRQLNYQNCLVKSSVYPSLIINKFSNNNINMASKLNVEIIKFSPSFNDQEPGTSGLRKNVKKFKEKHYTESFIQSILKSIIGEGPCKLVVGGDGRYYVKEAAELIIKMCAANGVEKIYMGTNGILSTPAASHLIRKYKTTGGILLTASHNPGGPTKDFGIKYNISNGGAAPTNVTSKIYEISKTLKEYCVVKPDVKCNIGKEGKFTLEVNNKKTEVEIIDPVTDYVNLMKEIFDFNELRKLISEGVGGKKGFKILIDSMHGVTGPYAKTIFEKELGAAAGSVINGQILEDFGGGHPDPNLTYARELVDKLMANDDYDFGAAFDGDGDRNMVLGAKAFFITPSDSLAILAANLKVIPYFQKNPIKGFARSMPTAAAVDRVGEALNIPVYETPTGWKFFGNLLDSNKVSLCGEESFGTGSDHIREKDGIWAVLAWLSVIAHLNKSVEEIMTDHWKKYGRNYTIRYDYENVDADAAKKMMSDLEETIIKQDFIGKKFGNEPNVYVIKKGDNFSYTDPTDNSVTTKQGLRILMADGSRFVYRLSGTGSSGATIRLYLEGYEKDPEKVHISRDVILEPLAKIAIDLAKIKQYTGRDKPTVIT